MNQPTPVTTLFVGTLFLVFVGTSCCGGQVAQIRNASAPRVVEGSASASGVSGGDRNRALKVEVDLVLVPILVTDALDRLVIGLTADEFTVYDHGTQQIIRHFSTEDAPISLGLIFDTSSSMSRKLEQAREAARQFFRGANPEDELFIVGFDDRPQVLAGFTDSVEEIQSAIDKVKPNGSTALLDAVYLGLDRMKRARHERKALLIISDGGDNHSRYNLREVFLVATEAGVQINALGIFDEIPRTRAERIGPDLLNALTSVTGGRTLPVRHLNHLSDAATQLAIELRTQYVIAYRPSNLVRDGSWHRLSVRVAQPTNSGKLHVYAKQGYYAPTR